MKIGKWAWLVFSAMPMLAGCKGFWNAPASNPTTTPTTLSSGDFYVLNAATDQVAGFYVNAGTLTALSGSPYALSAAPIAITVAPNNAFLYISTLGGIFVYNINTSTGQLTIGNSGQAISSDPAASMQVDATNSWLVEGVSGASSLFAIHINSSTGVAVSTTEQTVALPVSTAQQLALSPDNSLVLVAMGSGGTATIPFNSANPNPFGAAGNIAVESVAGAALSVAFDPITSTTSTPRLFYIGETAATSGSNSGGLRAFSFSTLKEVSGSPYSISGLAPYSILPFSSGDYVYVVNRQVSGSTAGVIKGFSVTETNSVLGLTSLGSTFAAGISPQALVEDNTKQFVFAVDFGGSPDLVGYTIDATKAGYLDQATTNSTGTDPVQASGIAALH